MDATKVGQRTIADSLVDRLSDKQEKVSNEKVRQERPHLDRSGYQVELSNHAVESSIARKKAHEIATATDPVRMERVEALKKQIDSGQYSVDPGRVADGILAEAIRDRLAMEDDSAS